MSDATCAHCGGASSPQPWDTVGTDHICDACPGRPLTLRVYTVAEREPPEGVGVLVWRLGLPPALLLRRWSWSHHGAWWRSDDQRVLAQCPTDLWAEIPEAPHD